MSSACSHCPLSRYPPPPPPPRHCTTAQGMLKPTMHLKTPARFHEEPISHCCPAAYGPPTAARTPRFKRAPTLPRWQLRPVKRAQFAHINSPGGNDICKQLPHHRPLQFRDRDELREAIRARPAGAVLRPTHGRRQRARAHGRLLGILDDPARAAIGQL